MPVLYVVPIVDTEGPTVGREDMYDSWQGVLGAMKRFFIEERPRMRDSAGGLMKISWFILDWSMFNTEDPEFKKRGHAVELHEVRDQYRRELLSDITLRSSGDGIYWHYHHPPENGSWGWSDDWREDKHYERILCRLLLDRGYFPGIFRVGRYAMSNSASRWLERFIPFDFSNIAPVKREFCDWSRAPTDWMPYHPSADDYQKPGNMRRMVARSLPVAAKGGSGTMDTGEVERAFAEARDNGKAIFSFHSHDYYKSMSDEFSRTHRMIIDSAARFPTVEWRYILALEAFRAYAPAMDKNSRPRVDTRDRNLEISFSVDSGKYFEPFIAVEYGDRSVERIDGSNIPAAAKRAAVGVNDVSGRTYTRIIKL